MRKISVLLACCFAFVEINAQIPANNLQFNKNGTFKILQFTDTHFNLQSDKYKETIKTIQSVLASEKPDFVVFTGDLVWSEPAKDALLALTKPIVDAGIPWTVVFGNHDIEFNISKEETWNLFSSLPNFIGKKGCISGVGNNMFPVFSSKNKNEVKNALFMFDSHNYPPERILGKYDWIKFDQIQWYREQSDELAKENNGNPVPAIVFFHIPLKEYKDMAENENLLIGDKLEGIASADINSGLFASMLDKKNVMGVFVGHDHDNNYVGLHKNIALGFGQATGWDAYGDLERGGRVIELYERKSVFKTWITTPTTKKYPFYYPSGLTEPDKNTPILPAQNITSPKNGVRYTYFETSEKLRKTSDIAHLTKKKSGILSNFNLSPATQEDHFAFKFESWIKIPEKGLYKFYTFSDDGSTLYIDGKLVVDNDGGHSAQFKNAIIGLDKGFHKIEVLYFEDYMGQELSVGVSGISIPEGKIPDEMLFIGE